MKTKLYLTLMAIFLLVIAPFSVVWAQDYEDPAEETIIEPDMEDEEELVPILKTAADYGTLETFLELLHEAGLTKKLQGDGPFTVLIPDDSAFAQLKPKQLERLKSDRDYLKTILSRHIIVGHQVEFGDEPETLTIKTDGGDMLSVEVTEESVRIEQAWVIDEQIECSNGVIHVIDAVLLPLKVQRED